MLVAAWWLGGAFAILINPEYRHRPMVARVLIAATWPLLLSLVAGDTLLGKDAEAK